MGSLMLAALAGALGAVAFAVLIRVPRRQLLFAALAGLVSAGIYALCGQLRFGEIAQVFLASVAVAALSELLARLRRTPAIVFLMPGLIPLVPGLLAYDAMYDLVRGNFVHGAGVAAETLFWAAAIGVGIALVLTLSQMFAGQATGRPRE